MPKNLLVLPIIALLVLVLWLLLKPQSTPVPKPDRLTGELPSKAEVEQLKQRVDALERDLNMAIADRVNLEQRLQAGQTETLADSSTEAENDFPVQNTGFEPAEELAQAEQQQLSVEAQLSAAGMPIETIQAMQQSVDQSRLQMLQLRDRASREGWDESDEFREQMRDLRNPYRGLRDEFGDDAFDQFLYASGIPNRVQVEEVYSGSAADNAGLLPGDIIVNYADNTIYSMTTLRDSTLEGFSGENILLEVNRDGESFSINVPRGPLGISMSSLVLKPDSMVQ